MKSKTTKTNLVRVNLLSDSERKIRGADYIYFELDDMRGSPDSIIGNLGDLEERAEAAGYSNLDIDLYASFEDGIELDIYADREETTEETKAREAMIARDKLNTKKSLEAQIKALQDKLDKL